METSETHPIMQASLNYYNFLAAKRKEDIIANREWARSENPPLPKYTPREVVPRSPGIINFLKSSILVLKP